jgi:osmotically-inducible protein OsmY
MRQLAVLTLLAVALSGCNRPAGTETTAVDRDNTSVNRNDPGDVRTSQTTTALEKSLENTTAVDRDNTGVNERDRDDATKTPIDQNENQTDIDITANIRKRVVDTEMSVNAQNVKIITQDGRVTLRGPVKSAAEKQQIEAIATSVAGADKVDSQLEVEQQ